MKTISRRLVVPLALLASTAFLGACANSNGDKVITYHADYPAYDSADNLFNTADLIVEATVSTQPVSVQELKPDTAGADPKLNPAAGAPTPQEPPDPVVISIYKASVTKVYKGAAQVGQSIDVQQLGGTLNGITYQEEEEHALQQNQGYVLFLQTYPDAPAALLNPLQGQYPLNATGEPVKLQENPVPLTSDDLKRLSGNK
ncbi:hypothetical protein N5079_16395 [Planotetraspora sp. A-T 1434]|uniref:hypothetical protein n=1 Tax=Planotetraspora sp. A-T 1434 TaxID=2979219 RepID=UPI0021C1EBC5|nr:hypothetical protein [Planotetraspora sp. A-T 1434]MCT9931793.1 hypothetical protein [Planotetraspora sp. A-T 1434]